MSKKSLMGIVIGTASMILGTGLIYSGSERENNSRSNEVIYNDYKEERQCGGIALFLSGAIVIGIGIAKREEYKDN